MTFAGALRCGCTVLWLTLATAFVASAQIAVPQLLGHVTDQTGTLSKEQQSSLEQTLASFEARKGSQLAVLIVPTTVPEEIEQYSLRVAEQWKLGRQKVDDGAILVVAKNDRAVRIEVGYGLEGALSDIVSKRIISETIVPRFQQGDYAGGVMAGIDQVIRVVDGEPLPGANRTTVEKFQNIREFAPFLFIVALGLGSVLRGVFGKIPGALITGLVVTALAWFVISTLLLAILAGLAAMVVTLIGGGRILHGIGGLSGRGGLGGGGFRGGGGGFGGGGASGRW